MSNGQIEYGCVLTASLIFL